MYLTRIMPERHRQMTFDDLFNFDPMKDSLSKYQTYANSSTTYTVCVERLPQKFIDMVDMEAVTNMIRQYNEKYADLHEKMAQANEKMQTIRAAITNKKEYEKQMQQVYSEAGLYYFFKIPKKNGKWRQISAPELPLSNALRELKSLIYDPATASLMLTDHHTTAYAYVENRSCKDALVRHQKNESNWYAHFDFHDFFGSTTIDFVMRMFLESYPFCLLDESGVAELRKALSLAFLDGGLPQGTPISPLITNVMMIPFDHQMNRTLNHFAGARNKCRGNLEGDHFVYTRYADDIHISCVVDFDVHKIEDAMMQMLKCFDAPFTLAKEKTHYGSRAGSNWMLGMLINKDNQITVGRDTKKVAKAMITNYINDVKRGKENRKWTLDDIRELDGKLNYYKSIEPEYFEHMFSHYADKFKVDFLAQIRADIKRLTA